MKDDLVETAERTALAADAPSGHLVIVGCSAEKTATREALAALDLYDGGCVPALRERLGHRRELRDRVRFLSAEHGLITADTPLHSYDRPLDPPRASELRPRVWQRLQIELTGNAAPGSVLIIAEPLYLVLLADLLAVRERPVLHWIPDHAHGWPQAAAILDRWKW